jgi:LacI family gluconate utilization system Gnt-I transcriptional repressor
MTEAGLDGHTMMATTTRASTVRLGAELFVEVLTKTPDLEAIFCCNDDLALGTLFECMRRGIRVPEDLSIIGFNDLEFCSSTFPTLSSVATPRHEMARRAAEIVLEVIRGSGERPETRRIDLGFTVVQRQSTRRNASAERRPASVAALS